MHRESTWVRVGLLAYGLLAIIVALCTQGTYDAGDSVQHYLFAHHALGHPENLLDHWAKPFFTLVSTPFAFWGFKGMQLMQILLALVSGWSIYCIAKRWALRPAWLAPVLALMAPGYLLAQYSGLTEPMFACFLVSGVALLLHERWWPGLILLSFLPFVRTEGFLLLPAIGLFLLWKGKWKMLPVLAIGTGMYALIGSFYYGDLLWIWTQNPYATGAENYGSGDWGHFFQKYVYIAGIPVYGLTILGSLTLAPRLFLKENSGGWTSQPRAERLLLVYGPFGIYFLAHVVFWAKGIGHSLGMIRAMIAIVPLGALIALDGVAIAHLLLRRIKGPYFELRNKVLLGLVLIYIAAFPFLPNPAALDLQHDFSLTSDQQIIQQAKKYLDEMDDPTLSMPPPHIYATHPSIPFLLKVDPFERTNFTPMIDISKKPPKIGDLLLWDSHFAVTEAGVNENHWEAAGNSYRLLQSWKTSAPDTPFELRLYEKN